MHRLLQAIGLLFVAIGVGGLVDLFGLVPPPGLGALLTGYVVPHIPTLVGFELFTNLTIIVGGIVVVVAAESLAER